MGNRGQRKRGQGGGAVLDHSKDWIFTPPARLWGSREGFETRGTWSDELFHQSCGCHVGKRESSQEAQGMVTSKGVRRAGKLGRR